MNASSAPLAQATCAGSAFRSAWPFLYIAGWAYVWTPGGDDLPTLTTTAGQWGFAVCAIAVHVAIGFLIGNPWAITLATAPALTAVSADATGALAVVMIAAAVPTAAFIAVGVLLRRHRENPVSRSVT